ncbi:type VI secretion system protein TssA [Iodobacter ciconiae]|uniref:Type VI secretion system protein TssA n=1 Tax=Iodobacter ciconiae TaxID=2496266 RepID=A0A3S8ZPF9_9NEIS|nr:type VI secretion system protein TssA [Iodobacter ciconiae]AZN35354.1 type VI secretion system protein TssA [Iodobacter ciconiae]
MTTQEKLATLLAPISADQPAGEDLGYSAFFDQIREARRADDPSLSQGDWGQQLKTADWGKVLQLCKQALSQQSKDLQLAAWYGEALVKTGGFAGAQLALQLVDGLLEQYWETCYPEYDPNDLDERVGKLEWFNNQMGMALREVALTDPAHGGYNWQQWQESREVENLGLKDSQAKEAALAEGKLAGEIFDKSVNASGASWFKQLHAQLEHTQQAYQVLDKRIDERFGFAAPNFAELRNALNACFEVVTRLRLQWGEPAASAPARNEPASVIRHAPPVAGPIPHQPISHNPAPTHQGPLQSRADAVRQLVEVARYFRQHEPHSPVALLAERAAKWAEMSLEEWLGSVIKDGATLGQLNELLDIKRDD